MRRLLVPPAALRQERIVVGEEGHRHLARVLRLTVGDEVVLFDGEGGEATARLGRVGGLEVELEVIARRRAAATGAPAVTLLQGLSRGERFEWVVQKATELGVARVVPLTTERAVQKLAGERADSRRRRWQKIAAEAARQSGRAEVPVIAPVATLEAAFAALDPGGLRLFFWEQERAPLGPLLQAPPPSHIVLAIGPEGGFSDGEAALARAAGFATCALGSRILRTETAAVAALAILGYALGDLA